ncbi:diacylglycerol/lipid kinase family protein [Pollutimonas harenae]|uniref:NAD(+)/NADH kinase n=1 Tax=Pollutimonas harenae TaxID=657015 RepID=A0A853H531_9BURK|nr:diacylglycerol kinase family protein [Pollutimonas harenae]NYT85224.1 NAD(+)/NADH kinase [Pollutimonas harenae]TEA72405.1 diacylglycerol kinase [Pollutimonas harenae]
MSSNPPLFFVLNGTSGGNDSSTTRQAIESAMQVVGRTFRLFVIGEPNDLATTVQEAVDTALAKNGIVVAVGGDGTINAVAGVALASDCVFGAIPQGTFNYFGRTHGIPEEITGALDDLLQGEPTPVQVGLVNDKVFLVNASVGLYPDLLEDREAFKQRYGRSRLVAMWSALVTALSNNRYLNLEVDTEGERAHLRVTTLFIGNNRLQLEQVGMREAEVLEQGKLAAIAVNHVGTLSMLWLAVRGALGRLGDADNVTGFSFGSLVVAPSGLLRRQRSASQAGPVKGEGRHSKRRIKVAADGEIMWLQTPLQFRVAPKPLLLIKRHPDADAA